MKRYWLFAYCEYYPEGGMHDFVADFDTIEEAKTFDYQSDRYRLFLDILDAHTGKIVLISGGRNDFCDDEPAAYEWRTPPLPESADSGRG